MKRRSRRSNRRLVVAALVAAGLLAAAQPGVAQEWPNRPIKLIVPYTPGTGQDTIARTLAPKLTEKLGQSIVIENRPGAAGNIGTEMVARAPADGYTILLTASPIVLNTLLYKDLSWDPYRDFVPIANVCDGYLALVVNNNVPANNVRDFIKLLKDKPGKLSYSSPGVGTPQHFSGEMLKFATNTFMLHVPYRGSAGAITGLIGGDVDAMFMPVHSALPQAAQGRLKVLAVANPKRVAVAPDVPTMEQAGGPAMDAAVWYAFYAPAKTPAAIVSRLTATFGEIVKQPDIVSTLEKQGLTINFLPGPQLTAMMQRDQERWGKVVKEKGLKGE